ncbi:MAG: hypothetical protein L0241_09345 [Planctomycetia bacterium]|nr:hypothetical protein [Planctomycetia bacterium]
MPACAVTLRRARLFGFGWHWLLVAGVTFVGGVIVFFVGGSLKGHADALAERDGISFAEVYSRGASSPPPNA